MRLKLRVETVTRYEGVQEKPDFGKRIIHKINSSRYISLRLDLNFIVGVERLTRNVSNKDSTRWREQDERTFRGRLTSLAG